MNTQNKVNPLQGIFLTLVLSLKAILGGIVLLVSDSVTLLKSAWLYLFSSVMGVKQSPHVTQWHGIPSVLNIPAWENLDFNFWRKPTYIVPTLKGMVKNKVLWLLEERRVEVIPDELLIRWVTHGPVSRITSVQNGIAKVDFSIVDSLVKDEDVFAHGPQMSWTLGQPETLSLTFRNGERYTPLDGAQWDLSKLHIQSCMSLLIAGRFHGNIHFGLPCTAAASLSRLNKKGILYQLLSPHLRFTLRINNEALRVRRAQDRSKAYAPFAVDGDEFVRSIAADVTEQLLEPGMRTPPWSTTINDLPFNNYGKRYYDVIKRFVDNVIPSIEQNELAQWQGFMNTYVPNFSAQEPAAAIATIIWQVCILHSADHYSFEVLMASERYSFNKIRLKTPALSDVKKDMPQSQLLDLACDPEDRFRSNVFVDTFARGHKHFLWSNTMDQVRYRFKSSDLQQQAQQFQQELLATEQQLEAEDINICPLNRVFQSICW